ncbi:hypothetical protein ABEB36_007237 [Hypothenemus hampei]|uniref:Uncharacterized protein n=1 Tax=Hypothenemus hampei TaxID=57062 RepID=A0ABD1ETT2_HYPHA
MFWLAPYIQNEKIKKICLPSKAPTQLGKFHITIQAPPNSRSLYFSYRKTFSIVLIVLVDEQPRNNNLLKYNNKRFIN